MLTLLTLALTFHFQIEVLFRITQQKTLQNSVQIDTTQTEGYRHLQLHRLLQHPHIQALTVTDCYSILTYRHLQLHRLLQHPHIQALTVTQTATASSHTQHYDVLWMC